MIRTPYNPNPWTARHSTPLVLNIKPLSVHHGVLIVACVLNEAVIYRCILRLQTIHEELHANKVMVELVWKVTLLYIYQCLGKHVFNTTCSLVPRPCFLDHICDL